MKIETYRSAPFIDREEEIEFFVDWFNEVPQRILFVYGPKSSGKTTVISYVVDNYLIKRKNFWVKYFNLRETLISSYETFLDAFFVEVDKGESESAGKIGINVLGFKAEVYQKIKKKQLNLFKVFLEEIEKIVKEKKKCVIIVDEIQKLRDVYMNGNRERELLKEFLNFCVSLTKERHLSHVVILTSNTVFIERIYNDARMKKTSLFYKIAHLPKEKVEEWLKIEGFSEKDVEITWDYLGGCIADILRVFSVRKNGRKDLKEYLEEQKWLAYTEIVDYLSRGGFTEEEEKKFKEVAKEILERGYFRYDVDRKEYLPIIEKWAEKEILFYDPLELKVTGNSRIYEKGMELLLKRDLNYAVF